MALGLLGVFDLAAAQTPDPRNWRQVDPENTLYIDVGRGGRIVIELYPEVAPRHVERIKALTRSGFYDGLLFHRVVPAFVAQAGCPRGDGYGGPGTSVRCEVSDLPYERGTLGMALAGKDTGGSQWFLTHRRTPHLEGKYTVFGAVESGLDVLDALVQGDRIDRVEVP